MLIYSIGLSPEPHDAPLPDFVTRTPLDLDTLAAIQTRFRVLSRRGVTDPMALACYVRAEAFAARQWCIVAALDADIDGLALFAAFTLSRFPVRRRKGRGDAK